MSKHPLGNVVPEVTFAVSSRSNTKALLLCLQSVLIAPSAPAVIQVRLEGEFPSFAEFYLEQLAELARQRGVRMPIEAFVSQGVRASRQWHMNECRTPLLWMGDDDCTYLPNCLQEILYAMKRQNGDSVVSPYTPKEGTKVAYIAGCKIDLNNRRGYPNFNTALNPASDLKDGCSFNHLYEESPRLPRVRTLDTGNVLFQLAKIRELGITFTPFDDSANCGGEDTLFGLQCDREGLEGYFAPGAIALHLEKPGSPFGEFAARGEMLRLAAERLGCNVEALRREFMPFAFAMA